MKPSIQTNRILPREQYLLAVLGLLLATLLAVAFLTAPGGQLEAAASRTSPSTGLLVSETMFTTAESQPAPTMLIAFGSTGEIGDNDDDPEDITERCDSGMFCFPDRDRG